MPWSNSLRIVCVSLRMRYFVSRCSVIKSKRLAACDFSLSRGVCVCACVCVKSLASSQLTLLFLIDPLPGSSV